MREPLVHAKVRESSRFVASPLALGSLVIADANMTENPPRLVGVAAVELDPAGASKNPLPIPWTEATTMPHLARTATGSWLAAYTESTSGNLSEVFVFQNGSATSLGIGDKFEAIDLSCSQERCLLLTTRLGQVSGAGADVWMGKPSSPVTSWRRKEVVPQAGDSDARPSSIVRIDEQWTNAAGNALKGPIVALFEGSDLVFWEVNPGNEPRDLGRIAAPHGIVDAAMLGRPVAFAYGAAIDDEGCAQQGGIMRVSRVGAADIEIRAHAPATSGAMRPLARGGIAAYLTPLGCGASRKVVYMVVLDDDGTPLSQPMPVSDAGSFAVATEGEKVDLWIQRGDEVVWIRARCGIP